MMILKNLFNAAFRAFVLASLAISLIILPSSTAGAAINTNLLAQAQSVRIFVEPTPVIMQLNIPFRLMMDGGSSQIVFAQIHLTFDPSKIRLNNEIQTTNLLGTIIEKTSMAAANSTGNIRLVLALPPGQSAPSGVFQFAQFPFSPVATGFNQFTNIEVVDQRVQIVDRSATELQFISEPAAIILNPSFTDVYIGDAYQTSYIIPAQAVTRVSYPGVNNGPVRIANGNNISMIAAERVVYSVNGVRASYTEMMGLPTGQLDTSYWLPWYNNVDLDTQLRIANVSASPATITVTIGSVQKPSFNLAAGASTRVSYPVNNGPVKIQSTQNIVAAERVIYKAAGGVKTSFTEMMALPQRGLNQVYYLPWYNNIELDTQLRIANVSGSPATVTVTIGGVSQPAFNLAAGASTRVSYPVNNGPVKIQSTQNIVAAERVIYKVNNVNTSFSEMMALPASQLSTAYWLPWYNNVDLDTQLRIANVSGSSATVTVSIGGVARPSFNLAAGASTRVSYPVNNGPVKIQSTQNIVAAERVIYKVNNIATSFTEMMGLPNSQLATSYWFPWYNNVDLDTQLRFGVP
jgi:hypothetical protein